MYCKYCGNKIDDDSRFCKYCGKDITNSFVEKHENENQIQKSNIIIKNGIMYENGYSIGKVPNYCNPNLDKLSEF